MAMYRIIDGGTIYTLDAVLTGGFTFSGRATDKPVQSGAQVTDHYVNLNNTITMSGRISDVKRLKVRGTGYADATLPEAERPKAVLELITELRALKESGRTFTLEAAPSSGTTFTDCVFESLEFNNDQRTGQKYGDIFAFDVTATIKQIRKSRRARVTTERELQGTTSEKTTGSGANQVPDDEDVQKALIAIRDSKVAEVAELERSAQ